jgi:hypothetical protein
VAWSVLQKKVCCFRQRNWERKSCELASKTSRHAKSGGSFKPNSKLMTIAHGGALGRDRIGS